MGKVILGIFILMALFVIAADVYEDNFSAKAVFKVRVHYINGDQQVYSIIAPASKLPNLNDGNRGFGAPKTEFEFGDMDILNVCRYEILSVDTLK